MKLNKCVALLVGSAFAFGAMAAKADFTYNAQTYNGSDTTKGVIWFDTVGAFASYDGAGLPTGFTSGSLNKVGDSTVNYQFLFTQGSFSYTSVAYTIDTGGNYGSSLNTPASVSVVNPNITAGSVTYQVQAWVGGTGYGVGNTMSGVSAATTGSLGGPNPSGPAILPGTLNNFASFAVVSVPEPTTIALGLFGAAGLLIRRRK